MSTAIVVGAGASLAQAKHYHPSDPLHHPPLDLDFFQKARRVAKTKPGKDLNSAIADLLVEVTASDEFDDPFDDPSISMEQYFADVFYEVDAAGGDLAFRVYLNLVRVYSQLLAATTNWIALKPSGGPIGQLLASEVSMLNSEDEVTVITFNQDLIIENVLDYLRPSVGEWCLQSLYGESGFVEVRAKGANVFPLHVSGCEHYARVRLLKLHGSMNWGLASKDSKAAAEELFPTTEMPVYVHDGREISGTVRRVGSGSKARYLHPLVVPPIYDKHRITRLPLIDAQWSKARAALETADRILLVGYSMPDADILAQQLLRRAFAANDGVQVVWVINPDAGIALRLNRRLKNKGLHLYEDFDSFLAAESRL